MDDNMKKTHFIDLPPYTMSQNISSLFFERPVRIEYECAWVNNNNYYEPTNFELKKVYVGPRIENSKEQIKNEWLPEELEEHVKKFFESGLKAHAENDLLNKPILAELNV